MDTITWGNVKQIARRDAQAIILGAVSPEPNTGCWLWAKTVSTTGYGQFQIERARFRWAHRLSYEAFAGEIPDGLQIDHLCRVRCCVNPSHLEPVTAKENMRRRTVVLTLKTHCKRGHPFDAKNTMRLTRGNGKHERRCRTCHREESSRRLAAKKEKHKAKLAYMRAYYHSNKGKESARKAEWYRARGKSLRRARAAAMDVYHG